MTPEAALPVLYRGSNYQEEANKPVDPERQVGEYIPLILRTYGREGEHQVVDLYTAETMWEDAFPEGQPPQVTHIRQVMNGYVPRPWSDIAIPEPDMFVEMRRYESLHGAEHITEARLFGGVAGQMHNLPYRDLELLDIGLLLHDLRKGLDGVPCEGHGQEAFIWFRDHPQAEGLRSGYTEEEMRIIERLTTFHDMRWREIRQFIPQDELNIHISLRAGDAVARWRIPIKSDHPDLNRIPMEDKEGLERLSHLARYVILSGRKLRLKTGMSIQEALQYKATETG